MNRFIQLSELMQVNNVTVGTGGRSVQLGK